MVTKEAKIVVLDVLKQLMENQNLVISLFETADLCNMPEREFFTYMFNVSQAANIELEMGATYYDEEQREFVYEIRLKR